MAATRSLTIGKIELPSLETLLERIRGLSRKDLVQNREVLLFAVMLVVVLYTAYMLVVEPERRRLGRLEAEQHQLQEELQALIDEGIVENAGSLQADLTRLENEVKRSEASWQTRRAGAPEGVSRGAFLREITLVPYTVGWRIVAVEEMTDRGGEEEPVFLETTDYRVTGEGTFAGLHRYLEMIENTEVPAAILEMDIRRDDLPLQPMTGSFVLRVTGLQDDPSEGPEDGGGA